MNKKTLILAMATMLSSWAMAQSEKKAYMVADAHLDTQWTRSPIEVTVPLMMLDWPTNWAAYRLFGWK